MGNMYAVQHGICRKGFGQLRGHFPPVRLKGRRQCGTLYERYRSARASCVQMIAKEELLGVNDIRQINKGLLQ